MTEMPYQAPDDYAYAINHWHLILSAIAAKPSNRLMIAKTLFLT
jgi:hypothetical protein